MKFSDIKFSIKLFGLTGLIGVLFIGVVWKFDATLKGTLSGFDSAFVIEEMSDLAFKTSFHLLQARQKEKDFLLGGDPEHINVVRSMVDAAIEQMEALKRLDSAGGPEHKEDFERDILILERLRNYRDAFQKMAEARVKGGLDHESGLQGTFTQVANALEMDIQEHLQQQAMSHIMVDYLQLRRFEKNYLFRKDKEVFKEKVQAQIDEIRQAIKASPLEAHDKAHMNRLVDRYETAFGQLVFQDKEMTDKMVEMHNSIVSVEPLVSEAQVDAKIDTDAMIVETKKRTQRNAETTTLASIFTVLLGALLSFFLVRAITKPLIALSGTMETVAQTGDFSERVQETGLDEIGRVGWAFNQMAKRTQAQAWLKEGAARLAEIVQDVNTPLEFAQTLIGELVTLTGSGYGGIFYRREESADYTLLASSGFALSSDGNSPINISFVENEGLAGRCAIEQKTLVITGAPKEFIKIRSTLGEASPHTILALPLVYQKKVLGVIELASFHDFTPLQRTLLDDLAPAIALSLENLIQTTSHIQALLNETQAQNEELQLQQEELTQRNEELSRRTEDLKASEEELQQQKRELVAFNSSLSERTTELELKQTELKVSRKITEQKSQDLERASRYKSEFLANMSHELRTPLNSLLILAKLFTDNSEGNLTEEQVESSKIIHQSGSDLLNLINDILDLSKIEAGKTELQIKPVHVQGFANTLYRHFKHVAEEKSLNWTTNVAEQLPTHIHTDGSKLNQIVSNFLANAFKFTKTGGVTVHFHAPVGDFRLSKNVLCIEAGDPTVEKTIAITVSDSGIGIPEEKQLSIFEAFQQADGTTSRQYGGTGLGLSISRTLARLLGCELYIQSIPGKGSVFTLLLPTKPATEAHGSKPSIPFLDSHSTDDQPDSSLDSQSMDDQPSSVTYVDRMEEDPFVLDDRTIIIPGDPSYLVIENDPRLASMACGLLRKKGKRCLAAPTGKSGLDLAVRYQPSGILFGDTVPDMDGPTLRTKLDACSETYSIPIQFITANEEDLYDLDSSPVSVLTKPIKQSQLAQAVKVLKCFLNDNKVRNLIVVEDDLISQQAIQKMFDQQEVRVVAVGSGEEAYELLTTETFDCMILDLGLPGMSGLDLLDKISEEKFIVQPAVIVYTGRTLSHNDYERLRHYTDSIVLKGGESKKRLQREVTLFLETTRPQSTLEKHTKTPPKIAGEKVFNNEKILVVDDDMRNTFALVRALKIQGLNVVAAPDGQRALELLEETSDIRCVLMDIMMPVMDGYETMREIRKQKKFQTLPIITLSAKAMAKDKEKSLQAGANAFLPKPVDIDKLVDLLKSLLKGQDLLV